MYCSKCGVNNPDDFKFCTACGAELIASDEEYDQKDDNYESYQPEEPEYNNESINQTKNKRKLPIIGLSVMGLVLLLGIIAISRFLPSLSLGNDKSYAVITSGGSSWIVDSDGKEITKDRYRMVHNAYKGNIMVNDYVGNWKLLDLKGKVVQDYGMTYDYISAFSENLAMFSRGGKYGYLNKKGEIKIQPVFDYAHEFINNSAAVMLNGTPMLINKKGDIITSFTYGDINHIGDGYYFVKPSDNYMHSKVVNNKGEEMFSGDYDIVRYYDKNVFLAKSGSTVFLVDSKGGIKNTLPLTYDYQGYKDGIILVTDSNRKYYYVDIYGKKIIDKVYDEASLFDGEYAVVRENGDYKVIDRKGKKVLDCNKYIRVQSIGEGIFHVDNIYGGLLVNTKGKEILKFDYDLEGPLRFEKNNRKFYSEPLKYYIF